MGRSERLVIGATVCLSVAACNAIAGLGDFQEVPCEPCGDGASPSENEADSLAADGAPAADGSEDAGADVTGDAGLDAAVDASVDALTDVATGDVVDTGTDTGGDVVTDAMTTSPQVDRRWARWIMPNSAALDGGATQVDGGEGGTALPNQAIYGSDTEGNVTDLVTHLVWTRDARTASTATAATAACATPWRVPTRIELVSILDTSRSPTVNPVFDVGALTLWTSSVTPDGRSWTIDFGTGAVVPSIASAVLCVQGGS